VSNAMEALKRGDAVLPIEAGRFLRRRRGPGSYEKAVRDRKFQRWVDAVLEAAYGPPVPGEDRDITEIRKILELTRESSGEPTVAEVKTILERARIEAKASTGTAVSERYSC
jgi:hypothetical protein